MDKKCTWLLISFMMLFPGIMGSAVVNSNVSTVALTGTLPASLTVAAAPGAVTFNLNSGGAATGSVPVTVTTTWVLAATRTSVDVYGSFASAAAALTDGSGHNIPSSDVFGQVTRGLPIFFLV
jgi:hypothetical protein